MDEKPDPLENTVPDPVPRRLPDGRRRAIEVCALICLVPALLAVRWIDDSHLAASFQPRERVTVVPHGGTGAIGHSRWRVLGRDPRPPPAFEPPPGSAPVALLVQVRALDAAGAKDAMNAAYQVRDRAGHTWTAEGEFPNAKGPAAGGTAVATVTANVPSSLVSEVVLEVLAVGPLGAPVKGSVQVLRFAH